MQNTSNSPIFNICGCILITISVVFLVLKFFFLQNLILTLAADGVAMNNQTYNLWGVIPGDTQTFTIRNFTIFNFSNPHQFLYDLSGKKHKPQFTEIAGFLYQQKSQFLNKKYSKDQAQISFDYWLYFDQLNGTKNVQEKYSVVNVAPLGFWWQLDTTPIWSFTLQGFGSLFVQMNNTIKLQAIGQGIQSIFFPNFDAFLQYCQNQGFINLICKALWFEPRFGLSQSNNYLPWVQAAYLNQIEAKSFLYKHFFPLPRTSFDGLLEQISKMCKSIDLILSNHYCGKRQCSRYDMTIKQIAGAEITVNPPVGDSEQSICTSNITCIGSPQIPTFLHHQFKQKHKQEKYQKLIFKEQQIKRLFTPYKKLLNIGFIQKVYQLGNKYDTQPSDIILKQIKQFLDVQTNEHAFVIWEWIKYMTNNFVLKTNNKGTRKIAGMAAVFSQALWQSSNLFATLFFKDIYAFLTHQYVPNCFQFINKFFPQAYAHKICSDIDQYSYISYYSLIQPCLEYDKLYTFAEKYGLNEQNIEDYCDMDENPSNMGRLVLQIMLQIGRHYNCSQNYFGICTNYDIITKQMLNSEITLQPYPSYRKQDLTANSWFQQVPTFQYTHFIQLAQINDSQKHTEAQIRDLFTFDKLLNGQAVQQLFLENNPQQFKQKYHWSNATLLRNYIRYVTIEAGFGGFNQWRSAKQLFFGYNDPFLSNLKQTDPMLGGDPSIQTLIAFNELNITEQQSKLNPWVMKTGIEDSMQVRQYVTICNKSYISYNKTYFDGENVHWDMVSPWQENVRINGTDGFQTPPNIKRTDKPSIFISSIARYSPVKYNQSLEKFGFQLYDFRIEDETLQSYFENPKNKKYYQYYSSLLNSSYQGFPLMISKTHFLGADKSWSDKIILTDPQGSIMQANQYDDTRLYIQPYTGTAFSATISLQSNYLYEPDILFPQNQLVTKDDFSYNQQSQIPSYIRLLPVVNTFRSGNISENGVNQYFSDLRWIIDAKRGFAILGFLMLGFSMLGFVGYKIYKMHQKEQLKKQSLLEQQSDHNIHDP